MSRLLFALICLLSFNAAAIPVGGAGISKEIFPSAGHHYYGGMGIHENTDALTIASATWQLVYTASDWETGLVNGVTFQDGATDAVSDAFADAGGSPNEVTVGADTHPFNLGEIIDISASTNYDGIYEIQSTTTHTFNIVSAFAVEAADAQVITRGGNLTITNAGAYKVTYHSSVAPANGNDVVDFKIYAGSTAGVPDDVPFSETRMETKTAGNYTPHAGCGIFAAAAGDVVSFAVKNITAENDVTFRYIHVSVFQL